MNAVWILLLGMAVVVGGVLVLRLHPFLSLIAGALVVALLTPMGNTYRAAARAVAIEVESVDQVTGIITLRADRGRPLEGTILQILRAGPGGALERGGSVRIVAGGEKGASESTRDQRGESPLQADALQLVTDCNGVAARPGRKQQEVNDQPEG